MAVFPSHPFLPWFGSLQNKPCQVPSNVCFLTVAFIFPFHCVCPCCSLENCNTRYNCTTLAITTPFNSTHHLIILNDAQEWNPAVSRARRRSSVSSVPCLMCYETHHSEMKGSSYCLLSIFNLPWGSYSGMVQDYEML